MTIQPLQRANFVDQAYGAIKQLIVGGELRPGGSLNIDALARRLGVSNSPIREALRRLEHERWVETVPFRGAFVRPLDAAELAELYETRQIIELAALRKLMRRGKGFPREGARDEVLAPARHGGTGLTEPGSDGSYGMVGDPGPLPVLREIVAEIEAAVRNGDALAYMQADARFHQTIVDLAGNRRLADLFRTLVEQGRSFMLGRTPEAMMACCHDDGPDEHARLLELIERGDRRGACRMLKMHLRISSKDLRDNHGKGEGQDDGDS